jgi:hypothetical protein
MLFLSGCGDDETVPAFNPPQVTVITTPSEINDTINIFVGDAVEFDISVSAEGGFNSLNIRGTDQSGFVVFSADTARMAGEMVNDFAVEFLAQFPDPAFAGEIIDVRITAVDDQNSSTEEEFLVKIEAGISEFTAVLIGGFNNESLGSSYDAQSDSVFFASNIRGNAANQARIDFVYYFADVPQRTIASPDNDEAEITWNAQNTSSWPFETTENSTRFKNRTGNGNFDDLVSPNDLASLFGEVGGGESRVTGLSIGDLIAFQIDSDRGSRYGAFEVTAVEGNSSGTITLEVKIQDTDN